MNKTTIEPLNDRIVVQRLSDVSDRTKGGLYIPDNAKEKPSEGTVIAVGPGRMLDSGVRMPPSLAPGDRVLFAKYGGTEVRVSDMESGEAYILMREDEVLARLRDESVSSIAAAKL